MVFTPRTIYAAGERQDKHDGLGSWCARCQKNIGLSKEYYVPRIPIEKGGRYNTDNCVILCKKCSGEVGGFNHPNEIKFGELPYFRI